MQSIPATDTFTVTDIEWLTFYYIIRPKHLGGIEQ